MHGFSKQANQTRKIYLDSSLAAKVLQQSNQYRHIHICIYVIHVWTQKVPKQSFHKRNAYIYVIHVWMQRSPTNFSAKERYLLSLFDGRKGFRNNPMIKPREKKPWMHGFSKQAQTSLDAWFFKASKSINKDIYIYLSAKRKIFTFVD